MIMEYQKITKISKIHNKIIHRQLQMKMIKKYLIKICISRKKQKIIDNLGINIIV